MIPVTITVAVLGVALVLVTRPSFGLGLLILSIFVYPEYLRVPVGIVQMSVPRFIATALVLRFFLGSRRSLVRWQVIDWVVFGEWVWGVLANVLIGAPSAQVNYMIGRFFDTALMYLAARTSILCREDLASLFLPTAAAAIVMGISGAIESITFQSLYFPLIPYMQWGFSFGYDMEFRYGFLRAQGSMASPIYFGVAMTLLFGLLWSVRGYCRPKWLWAIALLCALIGALSSMSSGPQQAVVALVLANMLYSARFLIKPLLFALVLLALFAELASNRHFYYLAEYINFSGGQYWYRAKLMDVAIRNLGEYWLFGFGGEAPNHWGPQIDGRLFVDVVNHYVVVAVNGGIASVVFLLLLQGLALRAAVLQWPSANTRERALLFGLCGIVVALIVSGLSVGFFSGALLMSYLALGLIPGPESSSRQAAVDSSRPIRRLVQTFHAGERWRVSRERWQQG